MEQTIKRDELGGHADAGTSATISQTGASGSTRRNTSPSVSRTKGSIKKKSKRTRSSVDMGKAGEIMRKVPSRAGTTRRGSISILAHQLRMNEVEKSGSAPVSDSIPQRIQSGLDSITFLAVTTVASTVALILAVLRAAGQEERHASDGIWGAQLLVAAGTALELGLRLYASGPAYCSEWVGLCDAFVVVAGVCLTALTRSGSAVLFLRTVRVAALVRTWFTAAATQEAPECYLDKNPAVQLYTLVMRAVRESNAFTAAEKETLRTLLSLLAHQQIYVDATLQRGNEAYWKEYGHGEDRPRGRRPSGAAIISDAKKHITPSSGSWASPLVSSSSCSTRSLLGPEGVQSGNEQAGVVNGPVRDDAVGSVLAKVDQWDFDPFELDEVTLGHSLVTLSTYLFTVKYNLFSRFVFSQPHFNNFMVEVERGYGSGVGPGVTNVYHSRRHAADVTQAVHYFLTVCNLAQHLQDVEVAALLLGSLIHDFRHPGKSNAFLTKTGHNLAITYNDVNVLENYHLSEAFFLLRRDECNFFRNVAPATAQELRQIMVSMVLATDLKQHFDVLGEFNSHLAEVREEVLVNEGRFKTYTSAMKVCIKSADISHPARATHLHLRWTRDIIQEFFLQGDEEKSLGLEPSPLCDRDDTDIASSQKNFIGFLVKPLFVSWASFLDCPAIELCIATLQTNEVMWAEKEKMGDNSLDFVSVSAAPAAPPPPPPPPPRPPKAPTRRSSVMKAMQLFRGGDNGGPGGASGGGEGDRIESGRLDRDKDARPSTAAAADAAGDAPLRTSRGEGIEADPHREAEEGGAARRQDFASSPRALNGVRLCGTEGPTTAAKLAAAAVAFPAAEGRDT